MRNIYLLIIALVPYTIFGQYCESDTEPERREVDTTVNSITDYFLHGHINGHIRNYFMTTINNGYLSDHYANATGGSIAYSTASWKGIHFGVKGIFTYNLLSSDLAGEETTFRAASGNKNYLMLFILRKQMILICWKNYTLHMIIKRFMRKSVK